MPSWSFPLKKIITTFRLNMHVIYKASTTPIIMGVIMHYGCIPILHPALSTCRPFGTNLVHIR